MQQTVEPEQAAYKFVSSFSGMHSELDESDYTMPNTMHPQFFIS